MDFAFSPPHRVTPVHIFNLAMKSLRTKLSQFGSRIEITIRDEISGNNSSVHATIKMLRYDQPYIIGNEESKIIRNILVKEHPHNGHQYQEITKLDNVPMYWIDADRANIGKCVLGSNQVIFIDGTNAAIYSDADEQN